MPDAIDLARVRGARRLDGLQPPLQESNLMPRIAELGAQTFRFAAMALFALLGPTHHGVELLLQSC